MSASPLPISPIMPESQRKPALQSRQGQMLVTAVVTLIALLNAIGLLLVIRRFIWATTGDLPHGLILMIALVSTASMAALRIGWRQFLPLRNPNPFEEDSSDHDWDLAVGWGTSTALILLAVGCCYPGYYAADWLIWFPLLIADQFWRQDFFDDGHPEAQAEAIKPAEINHELDEELAATIAFPAEDETIEHELEAALLRRLDEQEQILQGEQEAFDETESEAESEEILQQLYRVRDDQGREIIYGTVRADFEAGQRTAVVHVGFCPPLAYLPQIEAESLPGSAARVNVVQAFAHGARLDVRLPADAEADCHILIDMAASPREAEAVITD